MNNTEPTTEEYIDISEKVRSGEYFRDARAVADFDLHEPMSERYVYIFLTILALTILITAVIAWQGLFPLKPRIPFIFITNDIVEDYPHIKSLADYTGENPNSALRRFLISNYVQTREEYDAATFDRNHNAVQKLSTTNVVDAYENFITPTNPESPISLYQRNTIRKINILQIKIPNNAVETDDSGKPKEFRASVVFDATLIKDDVEGSTTRHQVDIAFKYKDIKLDSNTLKIEPYGFIVTSYQIKNL